MLKRTIPLLFAVAIVLIAAAPAQADHCVRCRFTIDQYWCLWGTNFGSLDCDDTGSTCVTFGGSCNHVSTALTPLSSEFEVASVERIDDEAPAPNEALVAKLDAPKPAAESTR
jgi:hypothetical protein